MRQAAILAPVALIVTLATSATWAHAEGNQDAQSRPGDTLAPPVIEDLYLVSSDIAAVTGTDDERREDTPNQIQVTLGAKVLFGKDSAQLTAAARARLAHVARDIRAQKPTRVSVSGYTDNLGSAAHGLALSRHRAEAVKAALQQELGTRVLFTAHGFGEAYPTADNDTERGRQLNRRVTVTYLRQAGSSVEQTRGTPGHPNRELP